MALAPSTPIFAVGDRVFDWSEVRTTARRWGDWYNVERRVREGLACLRFLEADERVLDPDAVDAAAEEFRQQRNLIAADEMSLWLEARGLEAEDWIGFIERSIARESHAADLDAVVATYPVPDREIEAAVECEAICSGALSMTIAQLAAAGVLALKCGRPNAPIDELDSLFEALRAEALTRVNLDRMIAARALDWTVVRCRLAAFQDEDAAREAAFVIRDERQSLSDVARAAGSSAEQSTLVLEDVMPSLRTRLLSAEAGAPIGPVVFRCRPTLLIVVEKARPTLENAEIRARAERAVLSAAVERTATAGARLLLPL